MCDTQNAQRCAEDDTIELIMMELAVVGQPDDLNLAAILCRYYESISPDEETELCPDTGWKLWAQDRCEEFLFLLAEKVNSL